MGDVQVYVAQKGKTGPGENNDLLLPFFQAFMGICVFYMGVDIDIHSRESILISLARRIV